MKELKKFLVAGMLALSLGCNRPRLEYSEIKHEYARVSGKIYNPGTNGIILPDSGAYFPYQYWTNFDGDVDFGINDGEIFNRFEIGDIADVAYREKPLEKKIVGYEFIDARLKLKFQ